LKHIIELEEGKVSEDALKLIVKISEGSVRDALSLLDRGLINQNNKNELNLEDARKIYGYVDKSSFIDLFKKILSGNEKEVLDKYKSIYDAGIEPKVFLNDFLEVLYYFKNINTLKLGSKIFDLNDEEFKQIKQISSDIDSKTFLIFWQFTLNTLSELELVSNQNIAIEMFLIRLLYLQDLNNTKFFNHDLDDSISNKNPENFNLKNQNINTSVDQIKNISQKEKPLPEQTNEEKNIKLKIDTYPQLINLCQNKKELKIKYELENNVNLISFSFGRIEISSNTALEKDFVKMLSEKLFDWTGIRWLISFSSEPGNPTIKEISKKNKSNLIIEEKKKSSFKELKKILPDLELIDIITEDNND